jgi:ubiquinone/menaquinone biosynthesis C-methylase UbiE
MLLVDNRSYEGRDDTLPFVLADATQLPFSDQQFDVCLLSTILHHADDPDRALLEAMRVSKGALIVVEDVYETWLDMTWLQLADSLISRELFGHPHNNKTARGWIEQFEALGLYVVGHHRLDLRYLGVFVFHIRCFVLEKKSRVTAP